MADFEQAFWDAVSEVESETEAESQKGNGSKIKFQQLVQGDYSDVRDAQGNQYVDLVMEGGGMLGFALLGYTYCLEQCRIRFWSIAGTSAGAISAMLLAGLGTKEEPKSLRVLRHLDQVGTSSFLDGDDEIRSIIEEWQAGTLDAGRLFRAISFSDSLEEMARWSKVDPSWSDAYEANGLFPGEKFRRWVGQVLSQGSTRVQTLADLNALLAQIQQV